MHFLLPVGSGAAEQLYEIVLSMKKDSQQISIFKKNPDLYRLFRQVMSHYKDRIPDYYNRLRQVRQLKLTVRRNESSDYLAMAFFEPFEIKLYKHFFLSKKAERLAILEHEFTHILQSMFEPKRRRHVLAKSSGKEIKYEHDFYEVETLTKDIYYEINDRRNFYRLRSQKSVANYIRNHQNFKEFKHKDKKKAFKKIMMAVFQKKYSAR